MKVLILAGGAGSRLWPLSTPKYPKQFLMIKPGYSLLQQTLQRFLDVVSYKDLFILTHPSFEQITKEQASAVCPLLADQIILEPQKKNTGFAIAWGLETLQTKGLIEPHALTLVSPADHIFFPESSFIKQLQDAITWHIDHSIGVFGYSPDKISKDFGYIKEHQQLNAYYSKSAGFIEKPALSVATRLCKEKWLWNLGIYLFTPSVFWQCLETCAKINKKSCSIDFNLFPSISIDHLIMEKATNLNVFKLQSCRWMDVGSLQAFNACKKYFFTNLSSFEEESLSYSSKK